MLIVLGAIIALGVGYRTFMLDESDRPVSTGNIKEVSIRIPKDTWGFDPQVVEVKRGDTVKLRFINEDSYDHGVGIDAYGISQRIPARAILDVPPFVVTKSGDFQFYCSVSCGDSSSLPGGVVQADGPFKGQKRGHFDQVGLLKVVE